MFNIFKKSKQDNNPFKLDWGEVSPDLFSEEKNETVYVLNFDFLSQESRELAMDFTVGKILWYQKHLPNNCAHIIDLDLRGQDEIKYELEIQDNWRDDVLKKIKQVAPEIRIEINIII